LLTPPFILVLFFVYLRWASYSADERKEQIRPILDEMHKIDKKLDYLRTTIDCMSYTLNQVDKEIQEIRRG